MVNNKRAKQTLALPGSWDQYRAINKKLNNNVVVILNASRNFSDIKFKAKLNNNEVLVYQSAIESILKVLESKGY